MKKYISLLLLLTLWLTLRSDGCESIGGSEDPTPTEHKTQIVIALGSSSGSVASFIVPAQAQITLDGVSVGTISGGKFIAKEVTAGDHTISAKAVAPLAASWQDATITLLQDQKFDYTLTIEPAKLSISVSDLCTAGVKVRLTSLSGGGESEFSMKAGENLNTNLYLGITTIKVTDALSGVTYLEETTPYMNQKQVLSRTIVPK